MSERVARRRLEDRGAVVRWECHCQAPPVLLGTYDGTGTVHIKVRDRYWHVTGLVRTTCPRCGAEHVHTPTSAEPGPAGNDESIGFRRP
jgi:hypothetical protein